MNVVVLPSDATSTPGNTLFSRPSVEFAHSFAIVGRALTRSLPKMESTISPDLVANTDSNVSLSYVTLLVSH